MLRVVVVGDEASARRALHECCDRESELHVVADCADGAMALEDIRRYPPDLLFMDVQMTPMNGIALAKAIPSAAAPHIVFVTDFDRFAQDTFEVGAVDYLLGLFDSARYPDALKRVRRRHHPESLARHQWAMAEELEKLEWSTSVLQQPRPRIVVGSGGRMHVFDVGSIERVEPDKNCIKVTVGCDVFTVRSSLQDAEATMNSQSMLKLSRSRAVYLAHVRELSRMQHGDVVVLLANCVTVTSSERYWQSVWQRLNQLQLCVREA